MTTPSMSSWLYEQINRVPAISDQQIAEMRHIHPVLKVPNSVMYRRVKGAGSLHPRNVSCLWAPEPVGKEFTFHVLNISEIITQHHSSVFFKPSLAEVYAWIRVYMPESWRQVQFFCLGEARRIGSSSDIACECQVMGGEILEDGREVRFADGSIGHQLVPVASKGKNPMTTPPLQPGQYWRTRSGSIVYVASVLPEWMNDPLPVMGISKVGNKEYEQNWYRLDGGFFEEGESDKDLVLTLPECDSLDWVPPEYPSYYRGNGDGYFRRDSKTDYVWVSPDGREVKQCGSAEILVLEPFTEITKQEAESRLNKSVPVELSFLPPLSPHDWPEDSSHENGNYYCECCHCGSRFIGHKRRVCCKVCKERLSSQSPKQTARHTAPEVWSLIEKADEKNEERFGTQSRIVDKLLIRICSAQQSMLSELSAQVDALRRSRNCSGENT